MWWCIWKWWWFHGFSITNLFACNLLFEFINFESHLPNFSADFLCQLLKFNRVLSKHINKLVLLLPTEVGCFCSGFYFLPSPLFLKPTGGVSFFFPVEMPGVSLAFVGFQHVDNGGMPVEHIFSQKAWHHSVRSGNFPWHFSRLIMSDNYQWPLSAVSHFSGSFHAAVEETRYMCKNMYTQLELFKTLRMVEEQNSKFR